ncbi:MAG: dihydroflavonol 4-reductase [Bacteroidetes bacterium HGW-Bacteroidetes-1]|jgi:nucleoside-diphosphate-sugar epimerase|nr:MAG: dihydroflavonol 4-reductase [Bacteroidetes bacterium HGW-Bacteroidetes-1]
MKTVFVTGINGLLGTNLTHLLIKEGYHVKGLIRDKKSFMGNHNSGLQLVEGELFDDLTKLLYDVDYVVHIAAITSQNLLDFTDYWKINCNATIQLFLAAAKCRVKRFVFVSTANTLGYGSIENPGNESDPVRLPFSNSFYAQSKMVAENYLLSHPQKMETIIVNPTFMLGAFDTKPSSGKIILMGWRKKVIFYPPGGKNFVHVEDVADGIIKCIEKGRNGEKYILGNENLSYEEFFKKLNHVASQRPVMVKIPETVLTGIGFFGELLKAFRIKTNLSLVNMKIICTNNYYSNNKSVAEIGIHYRPVDCAIMDALNYFKKEKLKRF